MPRVSPRPRGSHGGRNPQPPRSPAWALHQLCPFPPPSCAASPPHLCSFPKPTSFGLRNRFQQTSAVRDSEPRSCRKQTLHCLDFFFFDLFISLLGFCSLIHSL